MLLLLLFYISTRPIGLLESIVVPYELYEVHEWEKLRNFIMDMDGTFWNFTNFTFCWTICRRLVVV